MGKNNKGKGNRFKEKTYDEGDTIKKLELLSEKTGLPIWQLNPNEIESDSEDSENDESSQEQEKHIVKDKSENDSDNNSYNNNEEIEKGKMKDDNKETNHHSEKYIKLVIEDEEVITSISTPEQNEKEIMSEKGMYMFKFIHM